MTSCASKTVKAMATAAAIASMISAATFGLLSSSIEIDESATGELAGSVAAGLGAMATLTGAGVGLTCVSAGVSAGFSAGFSTGLARTTGGLLGLLSAISSEEGVACEETSGSEASADSTCSASDAGLALLARSLLELASGVSDVFSF